MDRQRQCVMVVGMDPEAGSSNKLSGEPVVKRAREGQGRARDVQHRQVAVCECGAQLSGGSRMALFEAAERHVAHHHPELVGALDLEVVMQMAEDVGDPEKSGH